jgi:hypothetical protein
MADRLEFLTERLAQISNVVDAQGRPAAFDGVPVWESSDSSIVDLRVAEDGMSAWVGSFEAEGAVIVTVTGDARRGEEVVPLVGMLSVAVFPPDVAVFDLGFTGDAQPRT